MSYTKSEGKKTVEQKEYTKFKESVVFPFVQDFSQKLTEIKAKFEKTKHKKPSPEEIYTQHYLEFISNFYNLVNNNIPSFDQGKNPNKLWLIPKLIPYTRMLLSSESYFYSDEYEFRTVLEKNLKRGRALKQLAQCLEAYPDGMGNEIQEKIEKDFIQEITKINFKDLQKIPAFNLDNFRLDAINAIKQYDFNNLKESENLLQDFLNVIADYNSKAIFRIAHPLMYELVIEILSLLNKFAGEYPLEEAVSFFNPKALTMDVLLKIEHLPLENEVFRYQITFPDEEPLIISLRDLFENTKSVLSASIENYFIKYAETEHVKAEKEKFEWLYTLERKERNRMASFNEYISDSAEDSENELNDLYAKFDNTIKLPESYQKDFINSKVLGEKISVNLYEIGDFVVRLNAKKNNYEKVSLEEFLTEYKEVFQSLDEQNMPYWQIMPIKNQIIDNIDTTINFLNSQKEKLEKMSLDLATYEQTLVAKWVHSELQKHQLNNTVCLEKLEKIAGKIKELINTISEISLQQCKKTLEEYAEELDSIKRANEALAQVFPSELAVEPYLKEEIGNCYKESQDKIQKVEQLIHSTHDLFATFGVNIMKQKISPDSVESSNIESTNRVEEQLLVDADQPQTPNDHEESENSLEASNNDYARLKKEYGNLLHRINKQIKKIQPQIKNINSNFIPILENSDSEEDIAKTLSFFKTLNDDYTKLNMKEERDARKTQEKEYLHKISLLSVLYDSLNTNSKNIPFELLEVEGLKDEPVFAEFLADKTVQECRKTQNNWIDKNPLIIHSKREELKKLVTDKKAEFTNYHLAIQIVAKQTKNFNKIKNQISIIVKNLQKLSIKRTELNKVNSMIIGLNTEIEVKKEEELELMVEAKEISSEPVIREEEKESIVEDVQVPVAEDVQVPVAEDVQVPVAEEVQVPVAEDVQVPVAEEVQVPITEGVQVPITEEVQVPITEEVQVQVTEEVQVQVTKEVQVQVTKEVQVQVAKEVQVQVAKEVQVQVAIFEEKDEDESQKELETKIKSLVADYKDRFDKYLQKRDKRFAAKDHCSSTDKEKRRNLINEIIKNLEAYAVSKDETALINLIKSKKQALSGLTLNSLLNQLLLDINKLNNPQETEYELNEELFQNYPAAQNLAVKIEKLAAYGEKINDSKVKDFAQNLQSTLNNFINENSDKEILQESFTNFYEEFALKLHSQDDYMAKHRKPVLAMSKNILFAAATFGVSLGVKLVRNGQDLFNGQSHLFFGKTTRFKNIEAIDKALEKFANPEV